MELTVIGAGLAGCEAAWQAAQMGVPVRLIEMKPEKTHAGPSKPPVCRVICSNSLKAARLESAAGMLKEEMRRFGSLLMACADQCAVPAGGAFGCGSGGIC